MLSDTHCLPHMTDIGKPFFERQVAHIVIPANLRMNELLEAIQQDHF